MGWGASRLSLFGFLKDLIFALVHGLGYVRFGIFRLAGCPFRCPLPRNGLGCPLGYRLIHWLRNRLLARNRLIYRLR